MIKVDFVSDIAEGCQFKATLTLVMSSLELLEEEAVVDLLEDETKIKIIGGKKDSKVLTYFFIVNWLYIFKAHYPYLDKEMFEIALLIDMLLGEFLPDNNEP